MQRRSDKDQRQGTPVRQGLNCKPKAEHLLKYGEWMHHTNTSLGTQLFRPNLEKHVTFRLLSPMEFLAQATTGDHSPNLLGNAACVEPATSTHAELHERALCPWYWNLNYDPNRIPSILPEAVCKCKWLKIGDAAYECHTLKYQVRVLKYVESCEDYELAEVAIGMACVAARTARERGFDAPIVQDKAIPDPNS